MIQDLEAIVPTDNYHRLLQAQNNTEYFSRDDDDDYDNNENYASNKKNNNINNKNQTTITADLEDNIVYQNGITVARIAVRAISEVHTEGKLSARLITLLYQKIYNNNQSLQYMLFLYLSLRFFLKIMYQSEKKCG